MFGRIHGIRGNGSSRPQAYVQTQQPPFPDQSRIYGLTPLPPTSGGHFQPFLSIFMNFQSCAACFKKLFSSSFIKIEAMWSKMHNLSRGDVPYRYAGTVCCSGSFAVPKALPFRKRCRSGPVWKARPKPRPRTLQRHALSK